MKIVFGMEVIVWMIRNLSGVLLQLIVDFPWDWDLGMEYVMTEQMNHGVTTTLVTAAKKMPFLSYAKNAGAKLSLNQMVFVLNHLWLEMEIVILF